MSLGKLHHRLQAAFGWTDAHLRHFVVAGREFGAPNSEDARFGRVIEDQRKAFLNRLVATGQSFVYT